MEDTVEGGYKLKFPLGNLSSLYAQGEGGWQL